MESSRETRSGYRCSVERVVHMRICMKERRTENNVFEYLSTLEEVAEDIAERQSVFILGN